MGFGATVGAVFLASNVPIGVILISNRLWRWQRTERGRVTAQQRYQKHASEHILTFGYYEAPHECLIRKLLESYAGLYKSSLAASTAGARR